VNDAEGHARAGDAVVRKLVTFGRILREAGVEVGPGRLQDALRALDAVSLATRDEVYAALACTLVSKRDDLEIFDRAFRAWFERAPTANVGQRPIDLGLSELGKPDAKALPAHVMAQLEQDPFANPDDADLATAAYSSAETLRGKDFADMTAAELLELRRACERLARNLPKRTSRRLEASDRGDRVDPRATLRRAMRSEGEPIDRAFRRQKLVERRVVFICDISGSMEPYARALVLFLQAAVATGRRVEAFTFGTRLTHLTPFLDGRDADHALARAAAAVKDWAGGTRIGESLDAFNRVYARRGMTRGAIVVIASDGWERGDTTLLGEAMRTLHRRSRAVVWINPLKGATDYQPLAGGMQAALPSIDFFLPGHNLASLEEMVRVIERLGRTRASQMTRSNQ
jgi:uncharacterized protein with von Willebrand factor type A (vWA) domain